MRRSAISLLGLLFALQLSLLAANAQVLEFKSPNEEVGGGFGSVGVIPDVNGDGLYDIVVGAAQEDVAGATDAGRAYLLDGPTGLLIHMFESPNPESGGFFGWSVSGVPDTNGNGRGDVLIGAGFEDVGSATDAGRAYIFDGSSGLLLLTLSSPSPERRGRFGGGYWLLGNIGAYYGSTDSIGQSVSGLSDVDGDGLGDVAIGASWEGEETIFVEPPGRVYVFNGSTGTPIHVLESPSEVSGLFGGSVSGVPDANGDGIDDVLVGAQAEASNAGLWGGFGRAYVFDGSSGLLLNTLVSPNPEDARLLTDNGGLFGGSVSGIHDVNGDDMGDVIIGAETEPEANGLYFDGAGRAYIYDGSNGSLLHILRSPIEVNQGLFGCSVSGIPDINDDGRGDVVVGSCNEIEPYPPLRKPGGRAYVFDGSSGEALATLESPKQMSGGFFGGDVAGIADLNGDGLGEVLVGARDENPDGSPEGAGRAYLFLSQPIASSVSNWALYE